MYNYKKIKSKIIEKGYTQREVAKILHLSEFTISNWTRGQIGNIEKFIELCDLIDLEIKELKKE